MRDLRLKRKIHCMHLAFALRDWLYLKAGLRDGGEFIYSLTKAEASKLSHGSGYDLRRAGPAEIIRLARRFENAAEADIWEHACARVIARGFDEFEDARDYLELRSRELPWWQPSAEWILSQHGERR